MPTVEIMWGIEEPLTGPMVYSFDTQAEMDAFKQGVEAAAEWLSDGKGYLMVETCDECGAPIGLDTVDSLCGHCVVPEDEPDTEYYYVMIGWHQDALDPHSAVIKASELQPDWFEDIIAGPFSNVDDAKLIRDNINLDGMAYVGEADYINPDHWLIPGL